MGTKKEIKNNAEYLVDINEVSVDSKLSKEERINEYIRQIKNPYHFKCGKFTVAVKFDENGPTMEECLLGIVM